MPASRRAAVLGRRQPASFVFNGNNTDLRLPIVSSSPNRKIFSISLWSKWTVFPIEGGSTQTMLDMSPDTNNFLDIGSRDTVAGGEFFFFVTWIGGTAVADAPSPDANLVAGTWYHLLAAVDTTQATAANRVKLYLSNAQQTITFVQTPAQNADCQFMVNGDTLYLGQNGLGTSYSANV